MREIPKNVLDFIASASKIYGDIAAEQFSQEMFNQAIDNHQSPIEDIFCTALYLQCFARYIQVSPEHIFYHDGPRLGYGIYITPQVEIGKYRVDFLLDFGGRERKQVIIELDGHDFHDRNKQQRAYEKSRDRFFTKDGYSVLHFTGSEVVKDPYKVTFEALDFLHALLPGEEYDPIDPFGLSQNDGVW